MIQALIVIIIATASISGAGVGYRWGVEQIAKVVAAQCASDGKAELLIANDRYRIMCSEPTAIAVQPWGQ